MTYLADVHVEIIEPIDDFRYRRFEKVACTLM